jgi:hypothetical protein
MDDDLFPCPISIANYITHALDKKEHFSNIREKSRKDSTAKKKILIPNPMYSNVQSLTAH